MKLKDTHVTRLTEAAQREDGCVIRPDMPKGPAGQMIAKLESGGLVERTFLARMDTDPTVWGRDPSDEVFGWRITPAGLAALGIDESEWPAYARAQAAQDGDPPADEIDEIAGAESGGGAIAPDAPDAPPQGAQGKRKGRGGAKGRAPAQPAQAPAQGPQPPPPSSPPPAQAPAATAAPPGHRKEPWDRAATGEIPAPPDFSAATHAPFRKKLAALKALVEAGDVQGLVDFPIEPKSSSRKALWSYRERAVLALRAQQAKVPADA